MRGSGEEPSSKLQSDFNTRQRDFGSRKSSWKGLCSWEDYSEEFVEFNGWTDSSRVSELKKNNLSRPGKPEVSGLGFVLLFGKPIIQQAACLCLGRVWDF